MLAVCKILVHKCLVYDHTHAHRWTTHDVYITWQDTELQTRVNGIRLSKL